jgi:uncharacterized protein (DUF58 family)
VSVGPRRRAFSRVAQRWLEGFGSTLRRSVRREAARTDSTGTSWSAFDRLQFEVTQPHRTTAGGEHRSRQRAPSPDFADYRPYQHGDDVRRIDWNVYGRLGVLQLRQTEAQLRIPILILLDCSASMRWGEPDKLSFARGIALALSRIALARSDSVSITCLGLAHGSIGPISGIRQFGSLEQFLSNTRSAGKIDVTGQVQAALEGIGPSRSAPGLIILISDLLNVPAPSTLFGAMRRSANSAVMLHVVSRDESEPEPIGDVDLIDAESGQIVEVGLSVDTVRQYRERYEAWRADMARQSGEHGIRYVRCMTERTVQEVVLSDLRAGRVVR